jgi:transposase
MRKLEIKQGAGRKKVMPLVMALANRLINDIGFVRKINETVEWDKKHWQISPGGLLKALVLSTFEDIRTPLYRLQERLEQIDLGYLIGDGAELKNVNSSNVGRALERLGEADSDSIYEQLALSAVKSNEIPVTRLHGDTTTISFYGEYDEMDLNEAEKEELLQIEKGYNKDGRHGDKQVVVGQIVNELGIPLVSRTLNGSISDVEWNKEAIGYLETIMSQGFSRGIFVADSKLATDELIGRLCGNENPIKFVTRCPANFEGRLERRMIEQAYETDRWEALGSYHEGKNASVYEGVSFIEEVCGAPMRMLVLRSSSLKNKVQASLEKKRLEVKGILDALGKKEFVCQADAEKEIGRTKNLKQLRLFDCTFEIEKEITERWPRGRRSESTHPKTEEKYRVKVMGTALAEQTSLQFIREESSFVIMSNVVDHVTDYDLLKIYKGQQVVENSFRQLKTPQLASAIYLKNPTRIKALTMVLSFSLLIRAIIQYRMRDGMKRHNEEKPGVRIYAGWGGRPLVNPTFKLFYEHSARCYFVRENHDHYTFSWPNIETENCVLPLLNLMGVALEELVE